VVHSNELAFKTTGNSDTCLQCKEFSSMTHCYVSVFFPRRVYEVKSLDHK
jgi:hypothetical protein